MALLAGQSGGGHGAVSRWCCRSDSGTRRGLEMSGFPPVEAMGTPG